MKSWPDPVHSDCTRFPAKTFIIHQHPILSQAITAQRMPIDRRYTRSHKRHWTTFDCTGIRLWIILPGHPFPHFFFQIFWTKSVLSRMSGSGWGCKHFPLLWIWKKSVMSERWYKYGRMVYVYIPSTEDVVALSTGFPAKLPVRNSC